MKLNILITIIVMMIVAMPSCCFCFETNNSDYSIYGAIVSGCNTTNNLDYNIVTNIGLQVIGVMNNTDYQTSLGFFHTSGGVTVSEEETEEEEEPSTGYPTYDTGTNIYVTCGDGICHTSESYETCPQDCPSEDVCNFFVPQTIKYDVIGGVKKTKEIMIINTCNHTMKFEIRTLCDTGYEKICNMNWFNINSERSSNMYIDVNAHENNTFVLYTLYPLSTKQSLQKLNITINRYDNNLFITKNIAITHNVNPSNIFENSVEYLNDVLDMNLWVNEKNKPSLIKKDNLTIGDLTIVFLCISLLIFGVYKIKKLVIK